MSILILKGVEPMNDLPANIISQPSSSLPGHEETTILSTRPALPTKVAVIDLGSNSAHLMVVQIWEDFTHTTIHEERAQIRLGLPVFGQGAIDAATQLRGLSAVRKFLVSCQNHEVETILTVATSALREAENSREVIERIKNEIGLEVNIISGREEARLTALAAIHSLGLLKGTALVIDVGGGSSEFAFVEDGAPKNLLSLQLGPVRILQQITLDDPPGLEGLDHLHKVVRKGLVPVLRGKNPKPDWTVGTSGTALVLGELCGTRDRAATSLETRVILRASLRNLLERLAEMTLEKRREWLGPFAERADTLIPGGMIFLCAMEELGLETLVTGAKALRPGIILDFLEREFHADALRRSSCLFHATANEGLFEETLDVRSQNILQLARRYGYEVKHCNKTLDLAEQIFEELRPRHWLGDEDRFYVESAALLHDIGYHINTTRHHHHSEYLVLNSDMEGFHQMEIRLLALLVRFHSHELPGPHHSEYAALPDRMRRRIDILAGILRVADALDFTHQSLVKTVKVQAGPNKLVFHVQALEPIDLEIQEALAKGNLLSQAMGMPIEYQVEIIDGAD